MARTRTAAPARRSGPTPAPKPGPGRARLVAVKVDFSLAIDYRSSHIVDRPVAEEIKGAHGRKLLRIANQIGHAERQVDRLTGIQSGVAHRFVTSVEVAL